MCGIFGFWLNRAITPEDISMGNQGISELKHRGPDNQNHWADPSQGIFLGHARLSIIDLSNQSNQPMLLDHSVLVYNGEIYNYKELAKQLQKSGTHLHTTGDTEVLLQAWLNWQDACLLKLDGMFAFALYQNNQLHLATDPFGEKPLYWAQTDAGFFFSSEPAPLVKHLKLKPDFSSEDIAAFLSLGFLPAPRTGYHQLNRLQPGTWLTYSPTQTPHIRQYWTPSPPTQYKGKVRELSENDLDTITETLVSSLQTRLRSDVPLGIFLSSGIDSALVAALTTKELNQKPLAFTVKFPDTEVADESAGAQQIANFLKLPHTIINSTQDPARTNPSIVFDLFGEVNDNITASAAYQMSTLASSTLKVALSGIGGDELFYGYNKYQMAYQWERWLNQREGIRRFFARCYPAQTFGKWRQLAALLSAKDNNLFIAIKNTNTCHWLWDIPEIDTFANQYLAKPMPPGLMARYFDLVYTLPGSFIPAIERASMRASLEVRTPFLNRQLFETLSQFDQRAFLAFGQKSVLKRILWRYLPEDLFSFKVKKGFKYPQKTFLDNFVTTPNIQGIAQSQLNFVWQNKDNPTWRNMATRLAILDHFLNAPHPT